MNSFLQSPEWETIQRNAGRKTWRINGVLLLRHDFPLDFNYLYAPRPAIADLETGKFLSEAERIGRTERSIFLKIDPVVTISEENLKSYQMRTGLPLQPGSTTLLDITRPETELFGGIHKKTRYNIKIAERSGIATRTVLSYRDPGFFSFWNILWETARRQRFFPHPREYYQKLLEVRTENFSNEIFIAEYRGNAAAAAMVNFYRPSGIATYIHGASSHSCRAVMAPHLLHWRIIQEAKRRGFSWYDFGGIDPARWPGVTRFKERFGGSRLQYPPTVDIVYRPLWYRMYQLKRRFFRREN